ncbi:putative ABC transporter ATP-binding protein YbhF [Planctomycetes bacterium Pla86]|uniref:Putative ABC transporter ATP-binding protein YbhF n=1 Tax=Engelhardtia mirabilis TaxID=2528011 RepID=A0A518BMA3_9BACT|nr:putative ABC transporter ATP-binding protein YbhF [Planctomycetes bacterium Pla133]QDV02437.1 putative ABC transporter ATP-binding protein YbhF [Planctomycetes bacterium Pla86]
MTAIGAPRTSSSSTHQRVRAAVVVPREFTNRPVFNRSAPMDTILDARGLRKRFGPILAVDGIDLTVAPGEVVGFLGPNGAGKSTTMKLVTGFLEPDAGSVSICGHDLRRAPLLAKRQLGYLPEGAPGYPDMTVREFLRFLADVRGLSGGALRERMDTVVEAVHLESVMHQSIETLSKGFRRRVGIAQALLHDPRLLILDEPTDGLDPNQKHEVRELVRSLAADKAVVLSTHILE